MDKPKVEVGSKLSTMHNDILGINIYDIYSLSDSISYRKWKVNHLCVMYCSLLFVFCPIAANLDFLELP
jgi:hypothetical protein